MARTREQAVRGIQRQEAAEVEAGLIEAISQAGLAAEQGTESLEDVTQYLGRGADAAVASPQQRFLALAKQKEAIVEQLKGVSEALEAVIKEIGVDKFLQDPETGLVYKTEVPKGRYVYFPAVDYIRTKKIDEDRGELSFSKAEEAGFNVDALKKRK